MKAHRHSAGHEHDFEPQYGLPEALPAGERLLWQGGPDWRALAVRAFHLRQLAGYFVLMLALRGAASAADGASLGQALIAMAWLLPLAAAGLGLVALLAWLSARSTVYTLTDRRVVMRIGMVLNVTFNLPFARLAAANLDLGRDGHGDIALSLAGRDRIAWLQLWPHVRPWRLARPEPTLRAVPQAEAVAAQLAEAWAAATGRSAAAPAPAAVTDRRLAGPAAMQPQ